ncbi:MAG: serine/threonine protein kinase, partial [Labilithrix sp.]|nr:serine/threonine protein kinase [Labilithrix sp.]
TPPGATVLEDGKALGVTPLDVPIERSSVVNGPRTFLLQKDGYTTTAFAQGASDVDVPHTVALARETARAVKSGPSHGSGGGRSSANGGGKGPAAGPTGESDIRLKR